MPRTFQQQITPKLQEIDQDKLRVKFLAENVHFNRLSFNFLCSRSLPYGGFKFGHHFKTHYHFIASRPIGVLMLLRVT